MSYRRRRGLGGSGTWLDRLRSLLPGGGEEGREDGADGGPDPGPGGGAGEDAPDSGGWRRAAAYGVLLVVLVGAGYLVSARWLFPASSEPVPDELVKVPELVGLTAEEARRTLDEAGLGYRERAGVPHRDAPKGAVVAQSPLPGQYARPGAPVTGTPSLGPERRRVPNLRGLSDRQGHIVLERLGFETRADTVASAEERGRVVGTRPESGTELTLPAEVTVRVSEGPAVEDVPDLTGLHVDDVEERLAEADLELGEIDWDPEAFAAPGRVVGQSPPAGYALRAGGRVSVRVAGSPPEDGAPTSSDGGDAPDGGDERTVPGSGRR